MAQATLDPSVVDAPPQEAEGDTDELLSKLAGEEIDHLLAEAEAGRPAPAPLLPATPVEEPQPLAADQQQETAAQLDELLAGMDGAIPPLAAASAPPAAEATAVEQIAASAPPPSVPAADAEEARLKVLAAELQVDQPGAAAVSELDAKIPAPPPPPPLTAAANNQPPIPWLLWPLIAINAPFAACPRSLRRLMGGVSLATFLTSLGAIFCVIVLKKHH